MRGSVKTFCRPIPFNLLEEKTEHMTSEHEKEGSSGRIIGLKPALGRESGEGRGERSEERGARREKREERREKREERREKREERREKDEMFPCVFMFLLPRIRAEQI